MKVLIYKRTHPNDPRGDGIFGIENCMGRLRNSQKFDAVIGIGAKNPDKEKNRVICMKLNWVGLGMRRIKSPVGMLDGLNRQYSDLLIFKHFALYEGEGEYIENVYPDLYKYAYENTEIHRGKTMQFCIVDENHPQLKNDIKRILDKVRKNQPEGAYLLTDDEVFKRVETVSKEMRCKAKPGKKETVCGGC